MKLSTRVQLRAGNFKRLAGIAAGLSLLSAGWVIYANHGYESSMLFLTGLLMVPLGVAVIGSFIVGRIDEESYD